MKAPPLSLFLCLGLLLAGSAHAIDANATLQIWKLKFGVTDAQVADPNWWLLDSDADGQSNAAELAAGTNPFSPSRTLQVASITRSGANVALGFPTESGKRYQAESTTTLANTNSWVLQPQPTPVQIIGDGTTGTLTVPFVANSFYRVRVTEVDTDGDGLSDWAERTVSLNPNSAQTVAGTNDLDYVNAQVALPNTVTIQAATPFASEDGPTAGVLTVKRTQNLFPTTVKLNVSGTAVAGTDYNSLPAAVTLAAHGDMTMDVPVNPKVLSTYKGGRSVTAAVAVPSGTDAPFAIGGTGAATVIIADSTAPTGTGLLARYYDTASSTYADAANFGQAGSYNFTRGTPTTTGSIVLSYTSGDFSALQTGHHVKISFTSGNLNSSLYNNASYVVTAKAASSFTLSITGAGALPASGTGNCNFSLLDTLHPPTVQRIDATVNNDWQYGTPNGITILPNNSPDNYSSTWETWLNPTTAGAYLFQLDADDKARVLLDLNDGNGLVQILEHNWDSAATVGVFKQSAPVTFAVPSTPAQRYHLRVEHVETTGDARCRLQWSAAGAAFANIPQANQYTHTQAMTYASGTNVLTVTPTGGHTLAAGNSVTLWFSTGTLFSPTANGTYTVATVTGTTSFTVSMPGVATTSGAGFIANTASTTTGLLNLAYANTTFTNPPGRVGVDAAVTTGNNGIWGAGTPDPVLIQPDTFSVRWTGQVQPQFSEDYTFSVVADDGCALWINGQPQPLKALPSANTSGSTYTYDSVSGEMLVSYPSLAVVPGSFSAGETVRLDPSSGNLSHGPTNSPTYTYDGTTGLAVVDYTNLLTGQPGGTRTAGSYAVGETVELDPTSGSASGLSNLPYVITAISGNTFTVNLGIGVYASGSGNITINDTRNPVILAIFAPGSTYSYNGTTGDAVVTYSSLTGVAASSFKVNTPVTLDPTSGNLSPLGSGSYTITAATATTFTVNFGTGTYATGTGNLNIAALPGGPVPASLTTAFTVNLGAGKYATTSGNVNIDIVNKNFKDWASNGNERYVRIPMVGGVRYDLQLDYYEATGAAKCQLNWFSASQTKQIIPAERLYPASLPLAPPAHVSPTDAEAIAGGPFSYTVQGSNGATVSVSGNPAWLSYANGVLSGTPPAGSAGDYQVLVTVSNAAGSSTSVVNLHVDENTGSVVREYWNGVSGTTVASIPVTTTPTGTANVTSLQAPTNFGDNYGARLRGYLTAPADGNYYFWIAGNDAAELWISNDDEPVNALKRAWLTAGSATPLNWSVDAVNQPNQKSPWLALEAGKRYYFEVLHKAGTGTGDNLAIGWLKPGEAGTVPSQVVPGYVLSPWIAPAAGSSPGTLYISTLLAQAPAVSDGVGNATLRLSEDESYAILRRTYSGLTGPITAEHIHVDPYLTHASAIVFDIDSPGASQTNAGGGLQADGSYKWIIQPIGTLSVADLVEIVKEGKAYINLHTAAYPAGEIRGNFALANGTRTFTAPPEPPAWTDDHTTSNGAQRFLTQATFGPNMADIAALKSMASYSAWIDDQFLKPPTKHLPEVLSREIADVFGPFDVRLSFNTWWKNSITAPDQLRQRVAFALSEIQVLSGQGPLEDNARAISHFYDTLLTDCFLNFRDVLAGTTLTPGMGRYLDMLRNDKPDLSIGRSPNENYAREIQQLFSVGLYRMWPDGSLVLNSQDSPVATYTQREVVGLAHVCTGWDYGYDGGYLTGFNAATNWTRPMREVPVRHDTGPKRVLNNQVLPGLTSAGGQPLDANANHLSTQYNDPAYQALPSQELNAIHDMLFNHPNTGPFICRQLIQRLVTSNPSRDYLYRVVKTFNDNGSGVRGDMKAVIKAILLDYEARSTDLLNIPAFGKQREPVMRVAGAVRAFRPASVTGSYSQNGTNLITIATSTPHLLLAGNSVFLEFTDTTNDPAKPAPSTGTYSVVSVVDATHYTVAAPGWITGTYNQTGTTTMTITLSGHWLPAGAQAYFDFTSGTADGLAGFDQTVRTVATSTSVDFASGVGNVSGTTFTITAPDIATRSGSVMIARFSGSYNGSNGTSITINTAYGATAGVTAYGTQADNYFSAGDSVFLNFTNSRDTTSGNPSSTSNDKVYAISSIVDSNTFIVPTSGLDPREKVNADDAVYVFPQKPQPLVRSGTIATRPGTFTMDNSDTDLGQTPLNSTTVFNFFLPDYKFPGTLASQAITTPEFQGTSETTSVRAANYFYNGIFNPANTTGLSGFYNSSTGNTNALALVMDLSPWMGNATDSGFGAGPQTGQVWTSNLNIGTLIDRLNTLLLAGQLPAGAKTAIQNFIGGQIGSIATGNPCTITMPAAHGLATGDSVTITGVTGGTFNTSINSTFTITVPNGSTNTFTVPVNCTSATGVVLTSSNAGIISYTNATPTTTNIRDRLRAIVHFILTSPDYTIQR